MKKTNPLVRWIMLAMLAQTEDLFKPLDDRMVLETESSLDGVGSERIKYAGGRTADRFPHITRLLSDIASPASSSVYIGRMVR